MSPRNPTPIESLLLPLKPASLQCIHRFMEYQRQPLRHPVPKRQTAAVAIILFVGRKGDLYVVLSTRSGDLRSYAHDTALPGGKYDDGDEDEEGTARREAYEEIGLPMDRERVRCLTKLDPFITGNALIVTPVVFLVTDNTINPVLNPDEVVFLFSMPLASFLYDRPADIPGWNFGLVEKVTQRGLAPLGSVPPPPVPSYTKEGKAAAEAKAALDAQSSQQHEAGHEQPLPWPSKPITRSQGLMPGKPPVPVEDKHAENIKAAHGPRGGVKGLTTFRQWGSGDHDDYDEGLAPAAPPPSPAPEPAPSHDARVGGREGHYYQYRDVDWGGGVVRMHRFLTGREGGGVKPVFGLTAAILVHAAMVGYDQRPTFEVNAPGQPTQNQRIAWDIKHASGRLRRAVEKEGMLEAWLTEDDGTDEPVPAPIRRAEKAKL